MGQYSQPVHPFDTILFVGVPAGLLWVLHHFFGIGENLYHWVMVLFLVVCINVGIPLLFFGIPLLFVCVFFGLPRLIRDLLGYPRTPCRASRQLGQNA